MCDLYTSCDLASAFETMIYRRSRALTILALLVASLCAAVVYAQADKVPPEARKKLTVGICNLPPFCIKDEKGEWSGITVDLWLDIARKLGLDYDLKETDLAGLQKGMDDKSFDLEICPAFITSEDEMHVDFSAPYFADDTAVAINSSDQSNLLHALKSSFFNWSFALVLALIIVLVLSGAVLLWTLEHRGESKDYKGKTKWAFAKSLYWSLVVLSGRDFPKVVGWSANAPDTVGGKVFAIVWTNLGLLLFSVFTAGAASMLTFKQLQPLISDWQDLNHLRVGTVIDSDAGEYLTDQHIKYGTYKTPTDMLNALSQHRIDVAVFGRAGLAYYAKTEFAGKIVVLPLASPQENMGLILPKGSLLRKPINIELLKVVESKQWPRTVEKYKGSN